MKNASVKNFIKKNGEYTNLYKVVKTILYNDNYCPRKYLDELFNNWQSLNYVLDNFDGFIKTKEGHNSFFSITPNLYDVYADAMLSINVRPIRWTDMPKKTESENNIHYVHYDMEVESMDLKTAKQILNENGFWLEDK